MYTVVMPFILTNIRISANSAQAISQLACAGVGLALVPEFVARPLVIDLMLVVVVDFYIRCCPGTFEQVRLYC